VITTKSSSARETRRTTGGTTTRSEANGNRGGRGVPRRALSDGVTERRRTPRRRNEPALTPTVEALATQESAMDVLPHLRSARDHYRVEMQRRQRRVVGDLATLLEEAKAEYEAQINAPRPPGKGGRPKKKPVEKTEFVLEPFGEEEAEA
jgi:hypothetical protein